MLKKGDKCYVRLESGRIAQAEYEEYTGHKQHFVKLEDGRFSLTQVTKDEVVDDDYAHMPDCRFVCMTGIRGNNENQKG